jgi:hypothetical protein
MEAKMVATDPKVVDQIVYLRAEVEVTRMVLQLLLGYIVADQREPQEEVAHRRRVLQERLAQLPSNPSIELAKARLEQFFKPIDESLINIANISEGQQKH